MNDTMVFLTCMYIDETGDSEPLHFAAEVREVAEAFDKKYNVKNSEWSDKYVDLYGDFETVLWSFAKAKNLF